MIDKPTGKCITIHNIRGQMIYINKYLFVTLHLTDCKTVVCVSLDGVTRRRMPGMEHDPEDTSYNCYYDVTFDTGKTYRVVEYEPDTMKQRDAYDMYPDEFLIQGVYAMYDRHNRSNELLGQYDNSASKFILPSISIEYGEKSVSLDCSECEDFHAHREDYENLWDRMGPKLIRRRE